MLDMSEQRFAALAGYTRRPDLITLLQEAAWYSAPGERLLGVVTWDRLDRDYGWVLLGRDKRLRFRAIAVDASLPDFASARAALAQTMAAHALEPDEHYSRTNIIIRPTTMALPSTSSSRLWPTQSSVRLSGFS
jgi:hypothetical protein